MRIVTDESPIKNWVFIAANVNHSSIKVIALTDDLIYLYLRMKDTFFIIYDIEDENDEKTNLLINKLKQYQIRRM